LKGPGCRFERARLPAALRKALKPLLQRARELISGQCDGVRAAPMKPRGGARTQPTAQAVGVQSVTRANPAGAKETPSRTRQNATRQLARRRTLGSNFAHRIVKGKRPYRVALTACAAIRFDPGRSHQIKPPASTSPIEISCVPVIAPLNTDPRPGSSRQYSRKNRATP
jgi:hypothetical protein